MDLALTLWMNAFTGQGMLLDAIGRFAAIALLPILAVGAIAVWATIPREARRRVGIALVGGAAVAYAVSQLIGIVAFRPRPFVAHPDVRQLIEKAATEKSFPSGHATLAFALATSIACMATVHSRRGRWIIAAAFLAATLIAVGRVYVGVHYVSDILAGALLGTVCAWTAARMAITNKTPHA